MTAITVKTTPSMVMLAPRLRSLFGRVSKALDALAMRRLKSEVPESALRQAELDIRRLHRLMHRDGAQQARIRLAAVPVHHSIHPR